MQRAALKAITDAVKPVLGASTYDELSAKLGPEFKKFESQVLNSGQHAALTPEEKEQMKDALVPGIKDAYKQVLVTQLAKQTTGSKEGNKNLQKLIAQLKKA